MASNNSFSEPERGQATDGERKNPSIRTPLGRVHVSWNHAHALVPCLEHVFRTEPLHTSAKHALAAANMSTSLTHLSTGIKHIGRDLTEWARRIWNSNKHDACKHAAGQRGRL